MYISFVVLGLLLFLLTPTNARQSGNGISGQVNCIAMNPPNKYAGTANGVYVFTKEENGWKQINNGLTNTNVRTLQIIDSTSRLVAGTENGIFLFRNEGELWEEHSAGLTIKNVWSLALSGGRLFAGTTNGGIFISTDRGENWSLSNNGLPTDAVIYSLNENGGILYAGTQKGVFISKDNGATWAQQ